MQCKNCFIFYEIGLKPLINVCGHTFCEKCINIMSKCLICESKIIQSKLKINYSLQNVQISSKSDAKNFIVLKNPQELINNTNNQLFKKINQKYDKKLILSDNALELNLQNYSDIIFKSQIQDNKSEVNFKINLSFQNNQMDENLDDNNDCMLKLISDENQMTQGQKYKNIENSNFNQIDFGQRLDCQTNLIKYGNFSNNNLNYGVSLIESSDEIYVGQFDKENDDKLSEGFIQKNNQCLKQIKSNQLNAIKVNKLNKKNLQKFVTKNKNIETDQTSNYSEIENSFSDQNENQIYETDNQINEYWKKLFKQFSFIEYTGFIKSNQLHGRGNLNLWNDQNESFSTRHANTSKSDLRNVVQLDLSGIFECSMKKGDFLVKAKQDNGDNNVFRVFQVEDKLNKNAILLKNNKSVKVKIEDQIFNSFDEIKLNCVQKLKNWIINKSE